MKLHFAVARIHKRKASQIRRIELHHERDSENDLKQVFDPEKSKLNKKYIPAPSHIKNELDSEKRKKLEEKYDQLSLHQRINYRSKQANAKFKKGGVKAVEMVLSASPGYFRDDASKAGTWNKKKTTDWIEASINFLEKEYGDNLMEVQLHLDEATPHIHAVIAPIMKYNRNRRRTKAQILEDKKREESGEAPIKRETVEVTKFCAERMFNKKTLTELQTKYAEAVQHLGIMRGIPGSRATHREMDYFYKLVNSELPEPPMSVAKVEKAMKDEAEKPLKRKFMESDEAYTERWYQKILKRLKKPTEAMKAELESWFKLAEYWRAMAQKLQAQFLPLYKKYGSPEGLEKAMNELKKDSERLNKRLSDSEQQNLKLERKIAQKGSELAQKDKDLEKSRKKVRDLKWEIERIKPSPSPNLRPPGHF